MEPRIGSVAHPVTGLVTRGLSFHISFFDFGENMRYVTTFEYYLLSILVVIAFVRAKSLICTARRRRSNGICSTFFSNKAFTMGVGVANGQLNSNAVSFLQQAAFYFSALFGRFAWFFSSPSGTFVITPFDNRHIQFGLFGSSNSFRAFAPNFSKVPFFTCT